MNTTVDPACKYLDQLVGAWETKAAHPHLPGVEVQGTTVIEWMEGRRFLVIRAHNDHPDFPDSTSILGFMGRDRMGHGADEGSSAQATPPLHLHYFDSRGVFRIYEASLSEDIWRLWREAPEFSQRFTGALPAETCIAGRWQVRQDDTDWADDLEITYHRL